MMCRQWGHHVPRFPRALHGAAVGHRGDRQIHLTSLCQQWVCQKTPEGKDCQHLHPDWSGECPAETKWNTTPCSHNGMHLCLSHCRAPASLAFTPNYTSHFGRPVLCPSGNQGVALTQVCSTNWHQPPSKHSLAARSLWVSPMTWH